MLCEHNHAQSFPGLPACFYFHTSFCSCPHMFSPWLLFFFFFPSSLGLYAITLPGNRGRRTRSVGCASSLCWRSVATRQEGSRPPGGGGRGVGGVGGDHVCVVERKERTPVAQGRAVEPLPQLSPKVKHAHNTTTPTFQVPNPPAAAFSN